MEFKKDSKRGNPDRISNMVQPNAQISDHMLALRFRISSGERYDTGVPTPFDGGDDSRNASPKSMRTISGDICLGAIEDNDVGWTRYLGAEMDGSSPENVRTLSLTGSSRWFLTSSESQPSTELSRKSMFPGVMSGSIVSEFVCVARDQHYRHERFRWNARERWYLPTVQLTYAQADRASVGFQSFGPDNRKVEQCSDLPVEIHSKRDDH